MSQNQLEVIYQDIRDQVNRSSLSVCDKHKLQKYATALCHPHAYSHFGRHEFYQLCETVRLALQLRMSEDANAEAGDLSKLALRVAGVALIVSVVQTVASILPLLKG